VNGAVCSDKDGASFIEQCLKILSTDQTALNHRLILRAMCNAFCQSAGETLMLTYSDDIIKSIVGLMQPTEKLVQIAISSLVLNIVVGFHRRADNDALTQCIQSISQISQSLTDSEAYFRLLVALGTAVCDDKTRLGVASSLDFGNFLRMCIAEETVKVSECAAMLNKMLY